MKKLAVVMGFLLVSILSQAQVKLNQDGLYIDNEGSLFTGTIENKENGVKQSAFEVKDGHLSGQATYYYASGKTMETGSFEKGQKDGKWLRYNESGITTGLAIYYLGKKNGTWLVWDDAGQKRFEMHYTMGEKTGTWLNWNEMGELLSSKDFSQAN